MFELLFDGEYEGTFETERQLVGRIKLHYQNFLDEAIMTPEYFEGVKFPFDMYSVYKLYVPSSEIEEFVKNYS